MLVIGENDTGARAVHFFTDIQINLVPVFWIQFQPQVVLIILTHVNESLLDLCLWRLRRKSSRRIVEN